MVFMPDQSSALLMPDVCHQSCTSLVLKRNFYPFLSISARFPVYNNSSFFSACYQKLMVCMIFQYLSYICTLEGDAYGTNFPLLYFVINIFMMKIDAYGEFISSVATHRHYASVDCKKEPDHVKPSTRRSQVQ